MSGPSHGAWLEGRLDNRCRPALTRQELDGVRDAVLRAWPAANDKLALKRSLALILLEDPDLRLRISHVEELVSMRLPAQARQAAPSLQDALADAGYSRFFVLDPISEPDCTMQVLRLDLSELVKELGVAANGRFAARAPSTAGPADLHAQQQAQQQHNSSVFAGGGLLSSSLGGLSAPGANGGGPANGISSGSLSASASTCDMGSAAGGPHQRAGFSRYDHQAAHQQQQQALQHMQQQQQQARGGMGVGGGAASLGCSPPNTDAGPMGFQGLAQALANAQQQQAQCLLGSSPSFRNGHLAPAGSMGAQGQGAQAQHMSHMGGISSEAISAAMAAAAAAAAVNGGPSPWCYGGGHGTHNNHMSHSADANANAGGSNGSMQAAGGSPGGARLWGAGGGSLHSGAGSSGLFSAATAADVAMALGMGMGGFAAGGGALALPGLSLGLGGAFGSSPWGSSASPGAHQAGHAGRGGSVGPELCPSSLQYGCGFLQQASPSGGGGANGGPVGNVGGVLDGCDSFFSLPVPTHASLLVDISTGQPGRAEVPKEVASCWAGSAHARGTDASHVGPQDFSPSWHSSFPEMGCLRSASIGGSGATVSKAGGSTWPRGMSTCPGVSAPGLGPLGHGSAMHGGGPGGGGKGVVVGLPSCLLDHMSAGATPCVSEESEEVLPATHGHTFRVDSALEAIIGFDTRPAMASPPVPGPAGMTPPGGFGPRPGAGSIAAAATAHALSGARPPLPLGVAAAGKSLALVTQQQQQQQQQQLALARGMPGSNSRHSSGDSGGDMLASSAGSNASALLTGYAAMAARNAAANGQHAQHQHQHQAAGRAGLNSAAPGFQGPCGVAANMGPMLYGAGYTSLPLPLPGAMAGGAGGLAGVPGAGGPARQESKLLAKLSPRVREEIGNLCRCVPGLKVDDFDDGVLYQLTLKKGDDEALCALRMLASDDVTNIQHMAAYINHVIKNYHITTGGVAQVGPGASLPSATVRANSTPVTSKAILQKLPLRVYKRLEDVIAKCGYMDWKHFDAGVIKVMAQLAEMSEDDVFEELELLKSTDLSNVEYMPAYLNKRLNNRLWSRRKMTMAAAGGGGH